MNQIFSPDANTLYQKIWTLTRERLSVRYPFFRELLWDFSFQESTETTTAGTDGSTIYFCPDFLIKCFQNSPDALEALLLHMLYHCLFLHLLLEVPSDTQSGMQLWKQACDLSVHRLIHGEKKKYRPAEIYQKLLQSQQKISDKTLQPHVKTFSVTDLPDSPVFSDDHHFWKRADKQTLLDQMKNIWNNSQGAGGLGLYGSDGRGTAPGNLQEEIALRQKHRYDFHRFLKRFAVHREELHTDTESFDYIPYVYGLEHYGNMPLIEYLEYQEMNRMKELVIAIDTSGSCSADTVRRFMEETYGILSNHENFFRKMNLYIIQCDSFIQNVIHVTCEDDWKEYLKHLIIHGRGGTDFRPVFEYVEKLRSTGTLRNLKGLLYFTDGDGIYPAKPTDYQTAFIFYREKSLHQKVPVWAYKLYMDEK